MIWIKRFKPPCLKVEEMNIKRPNLYLLGGLLVLTLVIFREVLLPGHALMTTDDNLGSLVMRKNQLPHGWLGGWHDGELFGSAAPIFLNLTNLLLWVLPAATFNNWINAFDLVVGSFFLVLFLRGRGLDWGPALLGMLTVYWLGSNFTLVYAGHIGKFGILLWVPVFLWLTDQAIAKRSWALAVLAGGAIGATFLEQADVALFFALALGPYVFLVYWREHRSWRESALYAQIALPLFLVALLLAVHPLLSGYQTAVEDIAAIQDEDPQAQWEFVTQWSWPPEESIDFIAPGFFGWRSGEPAGPYVGRMGRSAGWETTGEGFRNFKLENQYIGAIPIFFACMAIFFAWRLRKKERAGVLDIWFWSAVVLIALLLSFGKHFPLYRLFYQLPLVSSIRNPNKFLQVFQLALGILSAYGLHYFLQQVQLRGRLSFPMRAMRPLTIGGAFTGLALLLAGGFWAADREQHIARIATEWGGAAEAIVSTRIWALFHGGLMTMFAVLFVLIMIARNELSKRWVTSATTILLAAVVFDVLFLARYYVTTFRPGSMDRNEVVQFIQAQRDHHRIALTTRESFYNNWLSILFPYHGLLTVDVAQMPRMPQMYQQYLNVVGRQSLRHWELGGVRYILGPAGVWAQISDDASIRDRFRLALAYSVQGDPGSEDVILATPEQPGHHVVIEHRQRHDRFALVPDWQVLELADTLPLLVSPAFTPLARVLLAPDATALALPAPAGEEGEAGRISVREYRPGYMRLRVSAEMPAILRVADKYHRHWQATVNGEPVPVLRTDYIMKGVYVRPGLQEVILQYRPPRLTFYVQWAGILTCFVAGSVWVIRQRRSRYDAEDDDAA